MYTFSPMMVANSRKHHCRVRSYTREVLVISTNLDIQKNHYPLDFRNRRGDEARIKNTFMGRISFARALIEISSDRELKEELVVVIHVLDGTGYTKETIIVEYEWKPPHCVDCKIFDHSHEHCRKRVKEPEVVAMENQDDKFIEVIRKKNKGEKEDNSQPGHINGLKLNKPKPKYFYRLKEKKSHDKETNKDEEMNIVKLKNHFDALSQHEAIFRETSGETSGGNGVTYKHGDPNLSFMSNENNDDSDSKFKEAYNETKIILLLLQIRRRQALP
ncbi:hypothetical protein Tco_0684442 [Tanacetum coccineum]